MMSLEGGFVVAEVPVLSSQYECAGHEKAINHRRAVGCCGGGFI